MRGELVAFDLETTGLDIQSDSIIEVGAAILKDGAIIREFSTLINPGFVISRETTLITGIEQSDLYHAPTLPSMLKDIAEFVGDRPIIAHNAAFDVGFMNRYGLLKDNQSLDTLEMASILLPQAPRYSLGALTDALEIKLENAHRALDDAIATAYLYWHFWELALDLPYAINEEIHRASLGMGWGLEHFFASVINEQQILGKDKLPDETKFFQPLADAPEPLTHSDDSTPIDDETIAEYLSEKGKLSTELANYEYRPQQQQMAEIIARAFNVNHHVMIEAGTGTGKSIAYLVPSILWSTHNNEPVVVSTNTINLQDQLIRKDIPTIKQATGLDFQAAIMKGRINYLCPRRLNAVRRRTPTNLDELRILAKILVWLQTSDSGDRGELSLRWGEHQAWQRLSAQDEGCQLHRCSSVMQGACPFYKARKQAEAAHVLVVNHALLISDSATDNRVLPHYDYLIVDEAHQFEDAITNGLSTRVDQISLLRRLTELGSANSGVLGDLLNHLRGKVPDKQLIKLESFIITIGDATREMSAHIKRYFDRLLISMQSLDSRSTRHRIDSTIRNRAEFGAVIDAWKLLYEYFDVISEQMADLSHYLNRFAELEIPDFDNHVNATAAIANFLDTTRQLLDEFTSNPDHNTVYWMSGSGNSADYITIQSAPLHIGPMMEEFIWEKKKSVVMTSATLRTKGNFDYITERLYAEGVETYELGSPFDYRQSTLVYVPQDMPQPHERSYQNEVERGIIELATALNGRVMALFTSYAQLKETASRIAPRLALGNIVVFDQATGGSRESLLDSFKTTERSVLLGTRSFWEGVDIPGDDLSALVIVRLPFAVPSDPIFASRSDTYQNAFQDYAVPDAILRFRQGFGRLIRTRNDRGVVAILDSRVIHKGYGANFLESLPDVTLKYGSLSEMPAEAKHWVSLDNLDESE